GRRKPGPPNAARAHRSDASGLHGHLRVIKSREEGGGLIGAAIVCMDGDVDCDRRLFSEPHICAIARHEDYYRCVTRGDSTTAGGIVLRPVVVAVVLERPRSSISARVRP